MIGSDQQAGASELETGQPVAAEKPADDALSLLATASVGSLHRLKCQPGL